MAGNKLAFQKKATKVDETGGKEDNGFVRYGDGRKGTPNLNPYTKDNLKDERDVAYKGKITSIPSPYARMHITELAFYEYNCGGDLSEDYKRAMSHCLDIFELIYHSQELDLREKGITLQKITLYDGSEELSGLDEQTIVYLRTLHLYRSQYLHIIGKLASKVNLNYHFDFKSLYVLKHNGKVFAATSPFTGFFAKADCDLKEDIDDKYRPLLSYNIEKKDRFFLTNREQDWRLLDKRDNSFVIFMYRLLVKTKLCYIFDDMYKALEGRLKSIIGDDYATKYSADKFDIDYPQFNIGGEPLLKVKNLDDVYIRPDGLDCSYLKYLLYLEPSVDLTISDKTYDTDIINRHFPDGQDDPAKKWIGPNDVLSDALVILPYNINENYMSIPYKDNFDNMDKNRCLYPIRPFEIPDNNNGNGYNDFYRFWQDLIGNKINHELTIERKGERKSLEEVDEKDDVYFVVKLKVMLENGGSTVLRREYRFENSTYRNASDGVLVMAHKENPMTLAFGLYPFVKTKEHDNIYKVLFYNKFSKDIYNEDYDLTFYQVNKENGNLERLPDATNVIKNRTSNSKQNNLNCNYYSLKCEKNQLQFIELSLKKSRDNEKKEDKRGLTSLIVPNIREYTSNGHSVSVAIDLGTSNTYVAYYDEKILKKNLNI